MAEKAELRWNEVSYKKNAFLFRVIDRFADQDVRNEMYQIADAAAAPGMSAIEIESGPAPIDDENAEQFVERWLARLAQAFQGKLRPF